MKNRFLRFSLPVCLVSAALLATGAYLARSANKIEKHLGDARQQSVGNFREITWDDLIPPGWDPASALKGLDVAKLQDNDPRAMDALSRMREAWDTAPVEASLDGESIRIPGFVIPLEHVGDDVKEFLLLPYFGACIHVPPPPPNQIIYVIADTPLKNMQTMDALWVSGILKITKSESAWGRSAYQMQAISTKPYPLPGAK